MKITIPKYDEYAIGGGWSFIHNFKKIFADNITDYASADIYFIPGASLVSRDEVERAQADGKTIILRVDNVLRDSRNRGTGMSRMYDFAKMADVVIFQSHWAEEWLNPYLQVDNFNIIHNAVDESVFYPDPDKQRPDSYLYAKYSSDETKNWEMARSAYQKIWLKNEGMARLDLVGRFDAKLEEYNFDFYNGEHFTYHGLVTDKNKMADLYRQNEYLIYTYFQDACSNTLIEAIMCGCQILTACAMDTTGGAPEIIKSFREYGYDYFSLPRLKSDYMRVFNEFVQ